MVTAHEEDPQPKLLDKPLPDPEQRSRELEETEIKLMARISFHRRKYTLLLAQCALDNQGEGDDVGEDLVYHTERQVRLVATLKRLRAAQRKRY